MSGKGRGRSYGFSRASYNLARNIADIISERRETMNGGGIARIVVAIANNRSNWQRVTLFSKNRD